MVDGNILNNATKCSCLEVNRDFPGGSAGKESACNAGDPSLIPGLGRSAGEGIGYPLQYSWAFFVAQLVKNPPAMWETWVRSLGWQSSILAWRIPRTVHGVAKSQTRLNNFRFQSLQALHYYKNDKSP